MSGTLELERTATLTILSLEDEPDTIEGSLDSLEFEGHRIERCTDIDVARQWLEENDADLLLVDEHVSGLDDGGSTVIMDLKSGARGARNQGVAFGFVTGSRAWVDEQAVSQLPGYLGIEVKAGDLTRRLRAWIDRLTTENRGGQLHAPESSATPLRRVPVLIDETTRDEDSGDDVLILTIPAWDPSRTVSYPIALLPEQLRDEGVGLTGQWFIARMNLDERDPNRIVIDAWEPQEPLSDDDGLA